MRSTFLLKSLAFVLLFLFIEHEVIARKCTGSSNCSACSSCNYCQHCNGGGGTCGVCGGGDNSSSYSTSSGNTSSGHKKGSNVWSWIIGGIILCFLLSSNSGSSQKSRNRRRY